MSSLHSMTPFESTIEAPASNLASAVSLSPESYKVRHLNQAQPKRLARWPIASKPSHISPWLMSVVYPVGCGMVLPFYFRHIQVIGQENLPTTGPVILAPTHRSRWDAILVPYAAGWHATGRHLRFMVTADEMRGIQGWLIHRLGGFAINTRRPTISSLRHGMEILQQQQPLVIFPEGDIYREERIQPLKPGLARLALKTEAHTPGLGVQVVPISIQYSHPLVTWRSCATIRIGTPLQVAHYCRDTPKQASKHLTAHLHHVLQELHSQEVQSYVL